MDWIIPIGSIFVFFAVLLIINRRNLGVSTFKEYATANGTFGFLAISFAVLATWYVGATFTAWAGLAVQDGMIDIYVIPYATFTCVVMLLVGDRTFVWSKKHNLQTQSELIGYRYDSKTLQLVTGLFGVIFSAPWLLLEWVTEGYVFKYASGGILPEWVGMLCGIVVVVLYVSLGGMKSVITANFLQGLLMIVGGIILFAALIYFFFGGVGEGYQMLARDFKETLTYPGPNLLSYNGPVWTSMIVASAFGGFMWPWAYNKLFAASSAREIKKSALLAPALGALFYLFFHILGNFMHSMPEMREHPEEAFMAIAAKAGPWPMAIMAVVIMAVSVGTVSGIMQAMSSSISRDIAQFIKKEISDATAIKIARISVILICAGAYLWAIFLPTGRLIEIVLFTYQGIMNLFPVVLLGLYWPKATKNGAIAGCVSGTAVGMFMYYNLPNIPVLGTAGWSAGMYGLLVNFIIMIIAGVTTPQSLRSQELFTEYKIIKAMNKKRHAESAT